jgi:hypothetical protein
MPVSETAEGQEWAILKACMRGEGAGMMSMHSVVASFESQDALYRKNAAIEFCEECIFPFTLFQPLLQLKAV